METINDVLISELILRDILTPQEITGHITMSGGLVVQGNINTTTLNGLDVSQLSKFIVRLDQDTTVEMPVVSN